MNIQPWVEGLIALIIYSALFIGLERSMSREQYKAWLAMISKPVWFYITLVTLAYMGAVSLVHNILAATR